jgi:hypothetical protein
VLEETLQHARELLDIADDEMPATDSHYQVLAAAAPMLRAKLRVLRDRAG